MEQFPICERRIIADQDNGLVPSTTQPTPPSTTGQLQPGLTIPAPLPEFGMDDESDYFSADYDDDDTDTLASNVTQYKVENGRRYHAYQDGAYWGPNDESANINQDLTHQMFLVTFDGRLHQAPIGSSPQSILDVGTGTGIWAVEMADAYPSAIVVGTDLSAIQPVEVPPNCMFQIDDMDLPWTFRPGRFDYIHVREMFGCISHYPTFFREAFQALQPGGWIEVVEHSVTPESESMPDDHFFRTWGKVVEECGTKNGKSFTIWKDCSTFLRQAGFVDVTEKRFIWPIGPKFPSATGNDSRMKQLGNLNQIRLLNGVEGFMMRMLMRIKGWSYEQVQVFFANMRHHVRSATNEYLPGTVVYARKPRG